MTILFASLAEALAYLVNQEPGLLVDRVQDCVMGCCWKVTLDN